LIQAPGDSRQERRWNKHGGKNERDSDHGSRDLAHRLQCCFARRHSFFDVTLNSFDNDNGVIHDKSDCQHQPEKRK